MTTVSRTTPERSGAVSNARSGSEKNRPDGPDSRGAATDPGRIAQRAYELYEQGGRQEGRDLEDWLTAERQLAGAAGK
jgi:outer membrane protein TolC